MKYSLDIFKKHKLLSVLALILLIIEVILFILLPKEMNKTLDTVNNDMGITSIIPEVLSVRSLNALNGINKNDELNDYYELIKKDDEEYIDKYEILKSENIYVLKNEINKSNLEDLLLESEALYYLYSASDELTRRGFKPDETVVNYYLGLSSDNEIKEIKSSVSDMSEKELKEYAIKFVTLEYDDLKVNIESIKDNYWNKSVIISISISIILLIIIIINRYLSLKIYKKDISNLLYLIVGLPILINSIINIVLIDISKLINIGIILFILLGLVIIYNYLVNKSKIPHLNKRLLKGIFIILKPIGLILMNIIFILSVTKDIEIICYLIQYVIIILMSINYYIIYKK